MKIDYSVYLKVFSLVFMATIPMVSCGEKTTKKKEIAKEENMVSVNTRPNIILINADDLGYGDLGCYGATKVQTPNIDRLASEGRRFTDFHSASAVCSPSRLALITGEYPFRSNLWNPIFLKTPLVVDTTKTTIADVMKDAGYVTGIIGKWHLGFGTETPIDWNKPLKPGPLELGFDQYYGVPVVNSHPPFVYVKNHHVDGLVEGDPLIYGAMAETRWFREKFKLDEIGGGSAAHELYDDRMVGTRLKDKAIDFIVNNKERPFFLYYATTNIHHPFTPEKRFMGTSEAGPYGDFIHELDWIVGEILNVLKVEGLENNTMVIFTSDNGGMLNIGGQEAYAYGHHMNNGLLGFKFDAWEGGHRVPMIVRWPGMIAPGSVSDELLSNVDFMATMAALTERKLETGEGRDSYNMLPAFTGTPKKPIRDHLVISPQQKGHLALRKGKWMYIQKQGGGGFGGTEIGAHNLGGPPAFVFTKQKNSDIQNGKIKPEAPANQLYDLSMDKSQSTNVILDNPKIAESMQAILNSITKTK